MKNLITMKSNIKFPAYKLKPTALLAVLRTVALALTGNTNFPALPVAVADLTAAGDDLEAAIAKATNGSSLDRALRDEQVRNVRAMLDATAAYVRFVAQGERAVLESSGFEMAKHREPAPLPEPPRTMEARMTGRNGEVELRWHRVPHAHSYQVWMTDQDPLVNGSWDAIGITTKARKLVDGLEPYKAYWFCITAIGSAGDSALSEPVPARAA